MDALNQDKESLLQCHWCGKSLKGKSFVRRENERFCGTGCAAELDECEAEDLRKRFASSGS